jgi:3-phenylpropionate/trans-cinnamate dioxygenase ferredoxin reductase subunit
MSSDSPIIIVGTGHAGLSVAETLRRKGYEGEVRLIGEEPGLPYQRPPLSKQYLKGEWDESRLEQRNSGFFEKNRIDLVCGKAVTDIDPASRCLRLDDGSEVSWARLVLATGSRVRRLGVPGAEAKGVHYLQTRADADALKKAKENVRSVIVVGGGYIGLEGAAAFAQAGIKVTLLNRGTQLLSRSTSTPVSDYFYRLHHAQGVNIEFNTEVVSVNVVEGQAVGVTLDDGRSLRADLILVGIGVEPNTALAERAGLRCVDGVAVDGACRTSVSGILAAGDCTAFTHPLYGDTPIHLESIQNAVEQGRIAAATLVGEEVSYDAVPWFWSDQYQDKLQIAGLARGHDLEVIRGDDKGARFSVFCYAQRKLVAVESVNAPSDHMLSRRLLKQGISPTPDEAADPSFSLRDMLA